MAVEKIRAINNPLTIIAIFAALAEVAGTISLATVPPELQRIFIWFVMGFPTLIVIAFFFILFIRPGNLYAPGDFRDDEGYFRSQERVGKNFDKIEDTVKGLAKTVDGLQKRVDTNEGTRLETEEFQRLVNQIRSNLNSVQKEVEVARATAEEELKKDRTRKNKPSRSPVLDSLVSHRVLNFLFTECTPVTLEDISSRFLEYSKLTLVHCLQTLVDRGEIVKLVRKKKTADGFYSRISLYQVAGGRVSPSRNEADSSEGDKEESKEPS